MTNDSLTPLKLLLLCYPVIPSGGGETGKAPLVNWLEYQNSYPTDNDLEEWERKFKPSLWGIVTGKMPGVVIIDVDDASKKSIFDAAGLLPHIQTPRGGFHYWFRHPGHHVNTVAGLLPGVDVRGDGGFVNVIGRRRDGEYKTLIVPTPESVYSWDKLPIEIKSAMSSNVKALSGTSPDTNQSHIPEGQRNDTLARIGGGMRAKGLSETAIEAALLAINSDSCNPPLPDDEVRTIAKSVSRYLPGTGNNKSYYTLPSSSDSESERIRSVSKSVSEGGLEEEIVSRAKVEEWVKDTSGWFSYEEIDRELSIRNEDDKRRRRIIFKRLKDERIIESHQSNNKLFRYVNVAIRLIDFKSALNRTPLMIKYPFGIERYFNTYPGNVIALAGAADAGKTAFLLNVVKLNQFDFSVYYQSSEMGREELASRLEKFEDIKLDEWNFTPEERSRDFADVIRPDCINLVDYLELGNDFFQVGEYLKQIHDRLAGGICIVALQKKRGAELGRGGDFGLEKPRLYLSMDAGKITIQKAKNWVNPEENPKGLTLGFKLVAGCKFIVTRDWYREGA